jgi:hypothetical protein
VQLDHSHLSSNALPSRLAVVRQGVLWSSVPDGARIDPGDAFAVLVLWDRDDHASWLGWVTAEDRRAAAFRAADLADPEIQRWLEALPSWRPDRLAWALTHHGLHQVWRRPTPAG